MFPARMFKKTLVIVLAIVLSATITPNADGFEKHVIAGTVRDSAGTGIYLADVTATNSANMEVLALQTDMNGDYSFDLSNYPSGFANGQNIEIEVNHGQYSDNGSVIVNTTLPAQFLDLNLAMTSHLISGRVLDVDGSPDIYRPVSVTNTENGEVKFAPTNASGQYILDVGIFPTPPGIGDHFLFEVSYGGFYGFNSTDINAAASQSVDIWLSDVTAPEVEVNAPASVEIGQFIRVLANITDNYQLTQTDLFYKEVGSGFFTQVGLHEDDGGVYDWNANLAADPGLFGYIIPGQSIPGDVEYYIVTSDDTNINTTAPDIVTVADVIAPEITHTPITTLEAGDTAEIVSVVTDDVAVDETTLYFRGVGEATFSPIVMTATGEPDEYGATIPAQFETGQARYFIWAEDTSMNTNQSQTFWFNVTDTTPPDIVHAPVNSAHVWTTINITAIITDIVNLTNVDILVEDVLGGWTNNTNLGSWGGDNFSLEIPGQPVPGILNYTIWAKDSSPLSISVSHSVVITDNTTPVITHVPIASGEVFENITITANVTDDVGVTGVTLAYKNESDAGYNMMAMVDDGTGGDENAGDGNWTAVIPPPGNLEMISYFINATDGSNNQSHPALKSCHNISIIDSQPPHLFDHFWPGVYYINDSVPIFINITDNYMVNEVWLHYRDIGNTSWKHMQMTGVITDNRGNGTYQAIIPAQPIFGGLNYYFTANDTSNNTDSYSSKTTPSFLEIEDGATPELFHTPPANITVNQTVELEVEVLHPFGVNYVGISFIAVNGSFLNAELAPVGNYYYFQIPPQKQSGFISYSFSARDNQATWNSTDWFNISVTNALPVISHIPKASQDFEEALVISAVVSDDLAVEDVMLFYKFTNVTVWHGTEMQRISNNPPVYTYDLGVLWPGTIEYYLQANDGESDLADNTTYSRSPVSPMYYSTILQDMEPPMIVHTPIRSLNTSSIPIFRATVTDNLQVEHVTLSYMNASMDDYASIELAPVFGQPGNYSNFLEYQVAGDFQYVISASDGRFNVSTGIYSLEVTVAEPPDGDGGSIFLWALIILMAVAAAFILIGLKYLGQNGIGQGEDAENPSPGPKPREAVSGGENDGAADGPGENE